MPLNVDCPACGDGLEVGDAHRGWTVRCPSCRHEFVAASNSTDWVEPRRKRRSRRASDEELIDDAKALVASPASWLRGYGLLQVVFGTIGAIGAVAGLVWAAENPKQVPNQQEFIVNMAIVGFSSVCAVFSGTFTAIGAGKMARLESHGWGTTSAILAIGSIMYCSCGLFVGIPIGIWALMALGKRDVNDGFRAAARLREPHTDFEDNSDD